jgi:hypothetical protein
MKFVRLAAFLLLLQVVAVAQVNPVPLLNQPLIPTSTAPGSDSFTLTVSGSGFTAGSTVQWNGSPLATTFISGSMVRAVVPASYVANPGTFAITVSNPAPGGGTSNTVYFPVAPTPSSLTVSGKSFPAGSQIRWLATGDFNRDGIVDLVAADASQVTVLPGNGDGTLKDAINSDSQCTAESLAIGDFNNDGLLDLVVADDSQNVCVLLGLGNGHFTRGTPILVGFGVQPFGLAVADFNGDGRLDFAVVDSLSKNVSILLGLGDGHFQSPMKVSDGVTGFQTYAVAGDFNNDGHIDLAVAGDRLSILLGNGDGTFRPHILTGDSSYMGLVTADFNGDGNLDLAAVEDNSTSIEILLGNGSGLFQSGTEYPVQPSNGVSLAAGDFNNDGKLDLAWEGGSMLFGNGDGTFQPAVTIAAFGSFVAAADFDNNGRLDLAFSGIPDITLTLQTTLAIQPAEVLFPATLIGTTSQPLTVTLTNNGGSPIAFTSIAIGGPNAPDFTTTVSTCSIALSPGESCQISLAFTPTTSAIESASVSFTDTAAGSPQMLPLSGRGNPLLTHPTMVRFGQIPLGHSTPRKFVTLTNVSSQRLHINGIILHGAAPQDFTQQNDCGNQLAPAASCHIAVTFDPTQKGLRDAAIYIGIGPNSTNVLLDGTGI